MQYLFELLRTLREQLAEIGIHTTPGDDSRRHQIDQLIIKSYLLSTRAEDLQASLPEMQKYSDFEDARKRHMGISGFLSGTIYGIVSDRSDSKIENRSIFSTSNR